MNINVNGVDFGILYEDADAVAISKPPHVLSQKSEGGEDSVLEYLNAYAGGQWEAYPVHRLDRGTGGVMIVAKNKSSAAALSALASGDGMKKEYLACVHGKLEGSGTLEHYLYFDRKRNKSFPVKDSSRRGVKRAILDYEALSHAECEAGEITLVKIRLHTGRTHQIRVQMATVGHPLLGDGKYGGRDNKCKCALWSRKITFDASAVNGTSLKKRDFAKAVRETPDAFTSTPDGYPWDLFNE